MRPAGDDEVGAVPVRPDRRRSAAGVLVPAGRNVVQQDGDAVPLGASSGRVVQLLRRQRQQILPTKRNPANDSLIPGFAHSLVSISNDTRCYL